LRFTAAARQAEAVSGMGLRRYSRLSGTGSQLAPIHHAASVRGAAQAQAWSPPEGYHWILSGNSPMPTTAVSTTES